jgi:hypothetical protein
MRGEIIKTDSFYELIDKCHKDFESLSEVYLWQITDNILLYDIEEGLYEKTTDQFKKGKNR